MLKRTVILKKILDTVKPKNIVDKAKFLRINVNRQTRGHSVKVFEQGTCTIFELIMLVTEW